VLPWPLLLLLLLLLLLHPRSRVFERNARKPAMRLLARLSPAATLAQ